MKRRTISHSVNARPAGPWLRCFLSAAFWIFVSVLVTGTSSAQVDIPGPERLSHADGIVVSPVGQPMPDIEVTLSRDGKVLLQTRTDKTGEFRFEHAKGQYTLRVPRSQYSAAAQEITVTDEIVTALERKKLYVILGPGECQDACSAVLTSKKDFDRFIRKNSQHH